MKILRSASDAPAYHCDLERQLLAEPPDDDVLLFYINRPSVIIGRHQHPEAEADVSYCAQQGIEIVRRLSGGGAVYHDGGNINYAFIVDRGSASALDTDFATPVLRALQAVGVMADRGCRRDLRVGDRKISGTASCVANGRILFHGTLLHRVDLTRLACALQGDPSRRGKHIASVPAAVMNLSEITGADESTEQFLERLLAFFTRYYCTTICITG